MLFARHIPPPALDLTKVIDPDFVRRDPCLNCSLPFDCDETQPGCAYQNSKEVRTVPVDPIHLIPVALRRQRETRRETWSRSKRAASNPA